MTHRTQFLRRHDIRDRSLSIKEIASIGGITLSDAKEIYERGRGAWKTNIQSVRMKGTFKKDVDAPRKDKLSAEQWGYARLFAFLNKLDKIKEGKQKRMNQDCDIARKYYKKFECDVGKKK
jgi:hypothetical protein